MSYETSLRQIDIRLFHGREYDELNLLNQDHPVFLLEQHDLWVIGHLEYPMILLTGNTRSSILLTGRTVVAPAGCRRHFFYERKSEING